MVFSISSSSSAQRFDAAALFTHRSSNNTVASRLASKILSAEQNAKLVVHHSPFAELLKSRGRLAEGCLLGGVWIFQIYEFCRRVFTCCQIARQGFPLTPSHLRGSKLISEAKETIVSFVNLSGMTATLLEWADRVKIIVLGTFASLLKKFSYATYLITSGFGIEKAIAVFRQAKFDLAVEKDPDARNLLRHRYRIAIIDLTSHICTLVWAVLGIVGLIAGIVFSPWIMESLFLISCGLAFASIAYSLYIDYKLAPPSTPAPVPAPG